MTETENLLWEEFEALAAVYPDEFRQICSTSFAIRLSEGDIKIELVFEFPDDFPETAPIISVDEARGLDGVQVSRLSQKLANIYSDTGILMDTVEAAKEYLYQIGDRECHDSENEDDGFTFIGLIDKDLVTEDRRATEEEFLSLLARIKKTKNRQVQELPGEFSGKEWFVGKQSQEGLDKLDDLIGDEDLFADETTEIDFD